MKIYAAGVPGGGTTGDCKRERERVKPMVYKKIVAVLLDN